MFIKFLLKEKKMKKFIFLYFFFLQLSKKKKIFKDIWNSFQTKKQKIKKRKIYCELIIFFQLWHLLVLTYQKGWQGMCTKVDCHVDGCRGFLWLLWLWQSRLISFGVVVWRMHATRHEAVGSEGITMSAGLWASHQ